MLVVMRSVGVAPEMNLGIMQVIKEGPILVLKPSDKQGEQGYQWPKKTLKKKSAIQSIPSD